MSVAWNDVKVALHLPLSVGIVLFKVYIVPEMDVEAQSQIQLIKADQQLSTTNELVLMGSDSDW